MKTKYVLTQKPKEEPVEEILLTLEKFGSDEATIMIHIGEHTSPLVGVARDVITGKLGATRWSAFAYNQSEFLNHVVVNSGSGRIKDLLKD